MEYCQTFSSTYDQEHMLLSSPYRQALGNQALTELCVSPSLDGHTEAVTQVGQTMVYLSKNILQPGVQ